jgi:cell division protein FtsZ
MSIKLQVPKPADLKPRITVLGVGGAGGNAVNNMIAAGLPGVEFIVANTDAQALLSSKTPNRVQLGINLTEGLGAGSKPEIGEAAAKEAEDELRSRLSGCHMLFIAAGMGGGTGTGAAAVIARVAKELGILTIAVVTKPFLFEGTKRMRAAEAGIIDLKNNVDTLIVIPNQNLFRIANEKTTFSEAFLMADQVLYSGIACIVDLIVKDGLINLDLADVRTVLTGMGPAVMGTGEAAGDRRAVVAAEEAITNQLLDNMSLSGARGLLLSIIGGPDMTLYEVDEAASRVRAEVDPEANIIVGAAFDETMKDRVRVSIVASGMPGHVQVMTVPPPQATADSAPRQAAPATRTPPPLSPSIASPAPPPLAAVPAPARATLPPPMPAQASRATPPPLPNADADRSPDGIRIRPADHVSHDHSATPGPETVASTTESPYRPNATFEPRQLVEPRRAASRVPALSEFPPIGQKEYEHKTAQMQSEAAAAQASVAPVPQQSWVEPKKGKLFKRLAEVALGRSRSPEAPPRAAEGEPLPEFFAREKRAR